MVKLTFYEYLELEPHTEYSILFRKLFDINKLPKKMCSSKMIYNILIPDNNLYNTYDHTNIQKIEIFKKTFMEYFNYKLSLSFEKSDETCIYDEDKYIR